MRLRNIKWGVRMTFLVLASLGFLYLILRRSNSHWSQDKVDARGIENRPQPLEELSINHEINLKENVFNLHQQSNPLRDWTDLKYLSIEEKQIGPGEQGQAYYLPPILSKNKDKLFRSNGFNARASDEIALNRSLNDIRNPKCKEKLYPANLPSTSVIIPFFNEHWSTLIRTVVSVLNRSPSELLLEVILVDDGSEKEFLKGKLDEYIKEEFKKVTVIHLLKREGLIRARLAGARKAKGDVIIFLDSHTECTTNWLPPLLSPISTDYRTCVCPFIDVIDYETFAYRAQDEGARGAFDWQLFYKRLPLLPEDLKNMPEPFRSPVMAGGLFAISSKFFWELGGYDPGLDIWGGEQYELSFKIWQCGGTMIDVPCSRIGHIYRKFAPFSNPGVGDFLGRNYRRVMDVWMDEYAEFIFQRRPHYRNINPGDLSKQKEIRSKLNCKSFKWFMREIAFDLIRVYPPVEPPDFASGKIQSLSDSNLCIDTLFKKHQERFGLEQCGSNGEQKFSLTWHKDIRPKKRAVCFDVSSGDAQAPVLLYNCHGTGGNQMWKYLPETHQLRHGVNTRCLDSNPGNKEIFLSNCDTTKDTQKWLFENIDHDRINRWDEDGLLLP